MAFYNTISNMSNVQCGFSRNPKMGFGIYAKGYWHSATELAKLLLSRERFYEYDAYPVIFLYRHSFELYLKNIIYKSAILVSTKDPNFLDTESRKDHRLTYLSNSAGKILKFLFNQMDGINLLVENIKVTAEEFDKIDPVSYTYRYPMDNKSNSVPNQYVNLESVSQHMDLLLNEMEILDFGIDIETDRAIRIIEELENIEPSEKNQDL